MSRGAVAAMPLPQEVVQRGQLSEYVQRVNRCCDQLARLWRWEAKYQFSILVDISRFLLAELVACEKWSNTWLNFLRL